jgi:tetratricopeptide (TPR) repeat protein
MAEDTMFSEAVSAVRAGEVVRARDLLSRLLRADSSNSDYWLWMSAVVDSERESVYCLRSITKMHPNHPLARLGLSVMGQVSLANGKEGLTKQSRSIPMPHQSAGRINSLGDWWKVHRNRENAAMAVLGMAAITVILAIIILQVRIQDLQSAFLGSGHTAVAAVPSATLTTTLEIIARPVPTLRQTVNPSNRIPFATFVGVNFTPTSWYGLTPIPQTGAFDQAVLAFNEGRYDDALNSLKQVLQIDPKSAQAHFLIAEVYRKQWKMREALDEYELAIALDPNFAPAYFGRAMWSKQNNPDNDYAKDLTLALQHDPNYLEAYIERAAWYSDRDDWATARQDLETAEQIAPDNAWVLIRLGRAEVQTSQADKALDNIIRAQIIDPTILEGYLGLGEAYDELKLYSQAVAPLVVYTTYDPEEIAGWLRLGEAYRGVAQYSEAVTACSHAVDLDINSVDARLCRGLAYRLTGQFGLAADDLKIAADKTPNWYTSQFPFGCALLEAGQPALAITTLGHAIKLASNVQEQADAMGWQALAYEAYNSFDSAKVVWLKLMNLEGVPDYWKSTAYIHYYGLSTATPGGNGTPVITDTPVITGTPGITDTPGTAATPENTATPMPTYTPTPKK